MKKINCDCGKITGDQCCWSGPQNETVLVEWMPDWVRSSHIAAGNSGTYPHNGARRLRLEKSCAQRLIQSDPLWTNIIE